MSKCRRARAAYVQAHLVDQEQLSFHQENNDAMIALQTLKAAFTTDMRTCSSPWLVIGRAAPSTPVAVYRSSGFRRRMIEARPATVRLGRGSSRPRSGTAWRRPERPAIRDWSRLFVAGPTAAWIDRSSPRPGPSGQSAAAWSPPCAGRPRRRAPVTRGGARIAVHAATRRPALPGDRVGARRGVRRSAGQRPSESRGSNESTRGPGPGWRGPRDRGEAPRGDRCTRTSPAAVARPVPPGPARRGVRRRRFR